MNYTKLAFTANLIFAFNLFPQSNSHYTDRYEKLGIDLAERFHQEVGKLRNHNCKEDENKSILECTFKYDLPEGECYFGHFKAKANYLILVNGHYSYSHHSLNWER
ncbi:hypothetical protein N9N67_03740 [Bacteriovoracaceae bacterium]|nr:hypothetical protein [Bacteriovoracaceae bacterium]